MQKVYINGISGKMGQSISKLIKAGNDFRIIADDEFSSAETVIDFSHPLSSSKINKKCVEI